MNQLDWWDRSDEAEARIAEIERVWQGFLAVVAWSILVAWLFSLSTDPALAQPEPKQTGQEAIYTQVKYQTPEPVLSGLQGPSDSEWRSFWAMQLADKRQGEQKPATTPPQTITTTTVRSWQPEDECENLPNPGPVFLVPAVMRWCPGVARTLDWWDREIPGSWEDGELFHLMVSMACESVGNPDAVNPSSGTWGLFQHRPGAWAKRSGWWTGTSDAPRTPTNDIIVGVALVNDPVRGQGYTNAWNGCHLYGENGVAVRQTLANGGVHYEQHDH